MNIFKFIAMYLMFDITNNGINGIGVHATPLDMGLIAIPTSEVAIQSGVDRNSKIGFG